MLKASRIDVYFTSRDKSRYTSTLIPVYLPTPTPGLKADLFLTQPRRRATLGRALEVTLHDEIRLVNFFDRFPFFTDSHRQRVDADRPAAEFHDDGFQNALIHF